VAACALVATWTRPSLALQEFRISLETMGTYGGDSVQYGLVDDEQNHGPVTLWSAVDERYFAVYFAPPTITIDGQRVVVTIADPTGAGSSETWNGGNLQYSTTKSAWAIASSGSYLRVWQNHHDKCMYQPYPELKHSKGEELTCTRCDSDMDMVSGLSKTTPPGANGSMLGVDSARYYLSGSDIVVLADDGPEPQPEAGTDGEAGSREAGAPDSGPASGDAAQNEDSAAAAEDAADEPGALSSASPVHSGSGCRIAPQSRGEPVGVSSWGLLGLMAALRRSRRDRGR